jgi:UDP-2,3-diacylglucosamine pyrophosphatase LpxH
MAAQQKTIVISDIHISDGAKYSWFFPPYAEKFTAMLNKIANDANVVELVLLGDLFDLWVYPLDVVPWTVSKIIQANSSILKALQQCVKNIPNVYYMTGNHDMQVVDSDLQPFSTSGRNIQFINPEWYNGQYKNVRHLEHGHEVDMLNAPDASPDTIGGYPLGFFITRLVATAADQSTVWQALKNLLQALGATHRAMGPAVVKMPSMGALFVEAIIALLEKLAMVQDNTPIRFREPELDNKYTVGDIKTHYGSLYGTWLKRYPDPEDFVDSMLTGLLANGLDWYARKVLSEQTTPKVVLLGHTHHGMFQGGYYNDGCWCIPSALGHGDPTPNYVEIVGDTATLISWI